jgi:hypothetical protein
MDNVGKSRDGCGGSIPIVRRLTSADLATADDEMQRLLSVLQNTITQLQSVGKESAIASRRTAQESAKQLADVTSKLDAAEGARRCAEESASAAREDAAAERQRRENAEPKVTPLRCPR